MKRMYRFKTKGEFYRDVLGVGFDLQASCDKIGPMQQYINRMNRYNLWGNNLSSIIPQPTLCIDEKLMWRCQLAGGASISLDGTLDIEQTYIEYFVTVITPKFEEGEIAVWKTKGLPVRIMRVVSPITTLGSYGYNIEVIPTGIIRWAVSEEDIDKLMPDNEDKGEDKMTEKKVEKKNMLDMESLIKSVHFNDKKKTTTIVLKDGTVGMSTCMGTDGYDRYVGFSVALQNALFGSKTKARKFIDKMISKQDKIDKAKQKAKDKKKNYTKQKN